MGKLKRRLTAVLALLGIALCLPGCMAGSKYDEKQSAKIVEEGRSKLEAFVRSLADDQIEIGDCYMIEGSEEGSLIYGGQYLTRAVQMDFKAADRECRVLADLDSGKMWTDYYLINLSEQIERQLKPYCERYGYYGEYHIEGAMLYYVLHYKQMPSGNTTVDTYISFTDLLPVEQSTESEEEYADAILKDAPLDGFTIAYEILDGQYLDPRVLTDYLRESGNHRMETTREKREASGYELCGTTAYQSIPEEGICSWNMTLHPDESIEDMAYILRRRDYHKEGEFCFSYTGAYKEGNLKELEATPMSVYDFPIKISNGKIQYFGCEDHSYIAMWFEEKPKYTTFTRTCYKNAAAQETESLILQECDSKNGWYLTLEKQPGRYSGVYRFEEEQDLEFR